MSLKILLIVNLLVNLCLMLNRIWVLTYIGSGVKTTQESYHHMKLKKALIPLYHKNIFDRK